MRLDSLHAVRLSVSALALVVGLSSASAQSVQTSTGASAAAPGGFIQQTGSQKFFNVGPASAVTPLPSGSIVVIFNTGTNFADVVLGDISAKVTNANYVINPGTWRAFLVGTNKFLAAVSPGGTVLNIEGGDGFPPNAPGGSPTGGSVLPPPGATVRAGIGAAALGANADITSLSGLTTPLPISEGGTGGNDATSLRNSLAVASNGANSDITSLAGLTTPLSVAQGGTGLTSLSSLRAAISAAASGANSDITSLTGLTTAIGVTAGGTGANNAGSARTNLSAAALGVNGDITQLTGLTTPLTVAQGGTGASTAAGAQANLLAGLSKISLTGDTTSTPSLNPVSAVSVLSSFNDGIDTASASFLFGMAVRAGAAQQIGISDGSVRSASVTSGGGGSGYGASATGTLTWAGTGQTACATNPVLNVTTNSSGVVTTINSVTTAGACAVLPTPYATTWTAGGGLSAGTGVEITLNYAFAGMSSTGAGATLAPTFIANGGVQFQADTLATANQPLTFTGGVSGGSNAKIASGSGSGLVLSVPNEQFFLSFPSVNVIAATNTNLTLQAFSGDIVVGVGAANVTTATHSFFSPPFMNGVPTGVPAQNTLPAVVWNDTSGTLDIWSPHAAGWLHLTTATAGAL